MRVGVTRLGPAGSILPRALGKVGAGMPRRYRDQAPAAYVASGAWPDVELLPNAPVSAHYGLAVARRLETAMRSRMIGARRLAAEAGLSHPTITAILRGERLPDLGTLGALAVALNTDIYPAGLYRQLVPAKERGR